MSKKFIYYIILILLLGWVFYVTYFWQFFSCSIAGSYACAETWHLNISDQKLLDIIKEVKIDNPELRPPYSSNSISEKINNWYSVTFYYKETNENIELMIRANDDNTTTLAFLSIATHIDRTTDVRNVNIIHKFVNQDMNYFENYLAINKFEKRILDIIKNKIKSKDIK